MPRILIADDNSNIQRMVMLALQGEGIEVVAVGNGEAAIRKLPDVSPDLVLADIFMPVRNGYEVCEFIKHDSRYSHIPVVLLVGAFDPLDEVEAQRVSADGILKKPFVPPDPLIGMVKALLSKSANERLVAVAVPVAASIGEAHHTYPIGNVTPASIEPLLAALSQTATQELPALESAPVARKEKPQEFSPILEMPTADDADLIVTAHRDPSLGEPFWSQAPALAEPTAEDVDAAGLDDHTWGSSSLPLPAIESVAIDPPAIRRSEFPDHVGQEAAGSGLHADISNADKLTADSLLNTGRSNGILAQTFALESAPAPELAAMSPAVFPAESPVGHRVDTDLSQTNQLQNGLPEINLPKVEEAIPLEWSSPKEILDAVPTVAPEAALPLPVQPDAPPVMERASVPWWEAKMPTSSVAETSVSETHRADGQASHDLPPISDTSAPSGSDVVHSNASRNGSTPPDDSRPAWLTALKPVFPGSESLWASTPEVAASAPEVAASAPEVAPIGPGPVELATSWPPAFESLISPSLSASVNSAESVETPAAPVVSEGNISPVNDAVPALGDSMMTEAAPANAELMEATVVRIIERMQPKVLDVVTREILRPLVEALVRREIEKHPQ